MLKKPTIEDQRKLHAEVNQLVHQRFQLTTLAITVFGVIGAWLLPRTPPQPGDPVGPFTFAGSILLLVLLFVIFLYGRLHMCMLRVISTYLIVTEASTWEQDWLDYRHNFVYLGYTRPQSIIFATLGILAIFFPYVAAWLYDLRREPRSGSELLLVTGLIYLAAITILGFFNIGAGDARAKKKWESLNRPQ